MPALGAANKAAHFSTQRAAFDAAERPALVSALMCSIRTALDPAIGAAHVQPIVAAIRAAHETAKFATHSAAFEAAE